MIDVDLLGGSYEQKYKDFNSQRTINWYVVPGTPEEKDKNQIALYPTPGLTTFVTLPGRFVRGIFTARTHASIRCFAVCDTTLYEIFQNGSYTSRGTLTSLVRGSSSVYMVVNSNDQLGIFHPSQSFSFALLTNTLSQITDPQFPGYAGSATYSDGYAIITSQGAVWFSDVNAMDNWTGTSTYSPTFRACATLNAVALREQVFNFTEETIETYINDGRSPWSRLLRSTIQIGLVAPESIGTLSEGFIFLGATQSGEAAVYLFDIGNYSCTQISPFSINWALNDTTISLADAYSFIEYTKDGHIWYYLTVPALHQTFVYDIQTKYWHERSSQVPFSDSDGSTNYGEFRGKYYTNFNGLNLFTDIYSGAILLEDFTVQTEAGSTIKRERISKHYCQSFKNITISMLEFDCNTGQGILSGQGSNPLLMVQLSRDEGYTYTDPRTIPLGSLGNHLFRARYNNLGTARNWTVKFTLTDPVDLMIQNAMVRGSVGVY